MSYPTFTFEQIDFIHKDSGASDTLPKYAKALKHIGVSYFETFVSDGHTVFYDSSGRSVSSPAYHETYNISPVFDKKRFEACMYKSEEGSIGYDEMSKTLAASGVEKWVMDTTYVTFTYIDSKGNKVLVEDLD